MNKRIESEAVLSLYAPHVVCVTEIAPKVCSVPVTESELQVEGYDLFSNLDNYRRGVCIYIRKEMRPSPSKITKMVKFEESVWVDINLKGKDKLLVGCIYRSPNSSKENDEQLMNDLRKVCEGDMYSHFMLSGDFNIPEINWIDGSTTHNETHLTHRFLECTRDCFLTQHVTFPTHMRGQQAANILDLVFSNEDGMVCNLKAESPLGKSHHSTLLFRFMCYTDCKAQRVKTLNLNKGNYSAFKDKIGSYDWSADLGTKNCVDSWNIVSDRIKIGITEFIPVHSQEKNKPGKPLYVNGEVLKKVKKKSEAFKRYLETREGKDYTLYARARNQARWASRKSKRNFEQNLAKEVKTNPRAFYKYANSKLKTRTSVADLEIKQGRATTNRMKADELNRFFSSVFTKEDKDTVPQINRSEKVTNPMPDLLITEEMVKMKLKNLNPCKSQRQYYIILKFFAFQFVLPVPFCSSRFV